MKNLFHFENVRIALRYIFTNWLRTSLTISVIVFGIMALVGMITALDGIKHSLVSNLSMLGANSFSIERVNLYTQRHDENMFSDPISYRQATLFKSKYSFPSTVSVSYTPTGTAIVKFESKKSNPRIRVTGADENYLYSSNLSIDRGRNFSQIEDQFGSLVAVIGSSLQEDLFGENDPIGQYISVDNKKFKVIGVIKKQGSSFGFSLDNFVLVPINSARRAYPGATNSYNIQVTVDQVESLNPATEDATATFRNIRNLKPSQADNFYIRKSESLLNMLAEQFQFFTLITIVISIITLIGSAVGLMNIMLVSVKERIREIGTLKAIGATVANIKSQFLIEAILISQIGGILGILAGLLIGNFVASKLGSSFVVPWSWLIIAFITSIVVGICAGYYPAVRAARLNPIDALRYE